MKIKLLFVMLVAFVSLAMAPMSSAGMVYRYDTGWNCRGSEGQWVQASHNYWYNCNSWSHTWVAYQYV